MNYALATWTPTQLHTARHSAAPAASMGCAFVAFTPTRLLAAWLDAAPAASMSYAFTACIYAQHSAA